MADGSGTCDCAVSDADVGVCCFSSGQAGLGLVVSQSCFGHIKTGSVAAEDDCCTKLKMDLSCSTLTGMSGILAIGVAWTGVVGTEEVGTGVPEPDGVDVTGRLMSGFTGIDDDADDTVVGSGGEALMDLCGGATAKLINGTMDAVEGGGLATDRGATDGSSAAARLDCRDTEVG